MTPTASNPNSEATEDTRYAALELLISLTESLPKAVQGFQEWTPCVVRCCLEGMADIDDDEEADWLDRDVR